MIYRCANVLCQSRLLYPPPNGVCKNCAAPVLLVDEAYDEEDAIRDAMESVLDGFSRLLMQNDVANSRTGEKGVSPD